MAPKDLIQGIYTWIPSKLNVCHRVNFPRRCAPIMFPIWMRVFGCVGVLSVEKHPSGDYNPFADNRTRKCGCTPIHGTSSRRDWFRLNRSPSRSNFYDNAASLIRRFLRIHCDVNVGITPFHLLRPTVAAFDATGFCTNDIADNYRSAIGTESICVIAGLQHGA